MNRSFRHYCLLGVLIVTVLVINTGSVSADFKIIDFSSSHNTRMQNFLPPLTLNFPEGDVVLGDVPFSIPSGTNNVWQSGLTAGYVLEIPINENRVDGVHTLINTHGGVTGGPYVWLEFFGTNGAYYKKGLYGDNDIRDYYENWYTNNINGTTTTNVFMYGSGPGSEVRLDKQWIDLPGSFDNEILTKIRLTDDGAPPPNQFPFLAGVTVECLFEPEPPYMVFIPCGEFEMGDHHDGMPDALPVHVVNVDSFYMSKFEITNQLYCDYLNSAILAGDIKVDGGIVYASSDSSNDYPYFNTYSYNDDSYSQIEYSGNCFIVRTKDDIDMKDHPVVEVSWYGSAVYCNWLSQQDGYEACYNIATWECDFSKKGYHLPTEAELEYATRGGEHSPYYRYPWGDSINGSNANYESSGDPFEGIGDWPFTSPVGYYDGSQIPSGTDMANGYGLYDIVGNAWEWCNDWYSPTYYSTYPYDNPTGPPSGVLRVLRGGSWGGSTWYCRAADRDYGGPDARTDAGSFRVVRPAELDAGLVAYWSFDDALDPGHDDSGNENNGTVYGATSIDGVCGDALSFDGDDYVEVPDSPRLDLTGDFTIQAWINIKGSGGGALASKHQHKTDDDGSWFLGKEVDDKLSFKVFPPGTDIQFKSEPASYISLWNHIAITYLESQDKYAFYVNGVPAGSGTAGISGLIKDTSRPLQIGGLEDNPERIIGNIDEVRIYDRALSESEIRELATPCQPPCVATDYEFVTKWGSYGSDDGQFKIVHYLDVDSSGHVYVADYQNNRIQKFTNDGTYITQWSCLAPCGIAVDSSGYVYVTVLSSCCCVRKYTTDGTFVTQWGGCGADEGQFSDFPHGIAVDSSGFVYVADHRNHRVQKFTSDGTFVTQWGTHGSGDGQFGRPSGIAVDSLGFVYVSDYENCRVQKFESDGTYVSQWGSCGTGDGQFERVVGVADDPLGYIYVADLGWGVRSCIQKFTPDGIYICQWGTYGSGDGEFKGAWDVAFDSLGYAYVSDYSNHRIQKFEGICQPPCVAVFQGLGDLEGGSYDSAALGISDDGSVVVGNSVSQLGREAFRWTQEAGMIGLGDLQGGNVECVAYSVSEDGSIVVGFGSTDSAGREAFRWTQETGMLSIGDGFYSEAFDITSDGEFIVGQTRAITGNDMAFRWNFADGMVELGDLPEGNTKSIAYGVSADGSVVVGWGESASGREAFRWEDLNGNGISDPGEMIGLGDLSEGDFFSEAYGVSADGSVVVGESKSAFGSEAFRWEDINGNGVSDPGDMIGLGDLPGGSFQSRAYDVSADGKFVVGFSNSAYGDEAFIWDETNGIRSLKEVLLNYDFDMTGWILRTAYAVSDDGLTIVGSGINPNGNKEAWIARLCESEPVNTEPVADAGDDQEVSTGPDGTVEVVLDCSDSNDPDGDELTYCWKWMGGEECDATGINPTIVLPCGTYVIELIVNDGELDSEPDYVEITVLDGTPPVITCPADVELTYPADTTPANTGSATATDTCDDSPEITYNDVSVPGCGKTEVITRTWSATDVYGNSSSCQQVITIINTDPVADADGPYIEEATSWLGDSVDLYGDASSDPDGDTLSYEWDLDLSVDSDGDGDPANDVDATQPTFSAVFPIGQTQISLVVEDECGARSEPDITTVTVTVIEVGVEIRSDDGTDTINLDSGGVVRITFLTDEFFDALTVNPLTVTLRGLDFTDGLIKFRGKNDSVPMVVDQDYDGDGDIDRVVNLDTERLAEEELVAYCEIGALTYDGLVVLGVDIAHLAPVAENPVE